MRHTRSRNTAAKGLDVTNVTLLELVNLCYVRYLSFIWLKLMRQQKNKSVLR